MPILKEQELKVLFWGMSGEFSYHVLEGLIDAGINICAVVTQATIITAEMAPIMRLEPEPPRSSLPLSSPYVQRTIVHLAWQNQFPIYEVRHLSSPVTGSQLAALEADVAIVACFPRRIPPQLLAIPPDGFLNLHPSLLPALRGPFPLFWSFRLGQKRTGVTVHYMDAGLDTGEIALQRELCLPDGISGPRADALLAARGVTLLHDACRQLAAGTLPRTAQPGGGSVYHRPTAKDFQIPTSWSARRAFNFMRGTAEWGVPFHITGQGIDLYLRQAISFDASASQQDPLLRDGREYRIQFSPGVLHAH